MQPPSLSSCTCSHAQVQHSGLAYYLQRFPAALAPYLSLSALCELEGALVRHRGAHSHARTANYSCAPASALMHRRDSPSVAVAITGMDFSARFRAPPPSMVICNTRAPRRSFAAHFRLAISVFEQHCDESLSHESKETLGELGASLSCFRATRR